jgi:hypothetical protein
MCFEIIQPKLKLLAFGQSIGGLFFEPIGIPEIILISKGEQPFRTLRFKPKTKSKQIVSMNIYQNLIHNEILNSEKANQKDNFSQKQKTEIVFLLENEVLGFDKYENIKFRSKYLKINSSHNSDKFASNIINRELSKLVGVTQNQLISPRGKIIKSNFNTPVKDDKLYDLLAQSFSRSYEQLHFTFPEKTIGVGALWASRVTVVYKSAYALYISKYRVVDFNNNLLALEVQNEITPLSGFEKILGETTKLDSFSLKGYGKLTINLEQMMPVNVDQEFRGKLVAHSTLESFPKTIKVESLGRIKVLSSLKL